LHIRLPRHAILRHSSRFARLAVLIAVCAAPIAGALPALAEPPASAAMSDEALIAKVDAIAARALSRPGAAGLSIAVSRGDIVILSKGYGLADLEHKAPVTADTPFRIASITKQFTAAAIMRLVEQGKLSLDDDFTKHIEYPTQGRTVTIRQLLNHTSGLKSYTDVPGFAENGTGKHLKPSQVLDPVRELPFEFEPGSKWAYNNSGYILLGMIIEKLSGKTYAEHMQEEFFTPLGLTNTRYDDQSALIPGRARGYQLGPKGVRNAPYLSMTVPYAAGSLISTAGDLLKWQRALATGKVVSPESYTLMRTPGTLTDGSSTHYGFGLQVGGIEGRTSILHGGGIPGFNSMLALFPHENSDEAVGVAVISNTAGVPAGQVSQDVAKAALGIADAPREELKDLTLTPEQIDLLLGTYRIEALKMDLSVTVVNGKLVTQATGQRPAPLVAQSAREFRAEWDPTLKLTFETPADGTATSPGFTLEQRGEMFKGVRVGAER
jgi:D-alanyl-D-alanine carboxypeptidase